MYAREVGNQTLTFAVSGMLWNRSLVMQDQETKSLWSHILGRAMQGPLQGEDLDMLASQMTDWKTWRTRHPRTSVVKLSRTSHEFVREVYRDPAQFVLGMVVEGQPRAWSFDQLVESPVVNSQQENTALLVFFDASSKTALVFERRLKGQILTFEIVDGQLIDRQTRSRWDGLTGAALAGPMVGEVLSPLPAVVSYATAWLTFHPETIGLSEEVVTKARRMTRGRGRRGGR